MTVGKPGYHLRVLQDGSSHDHPVNAQIKDAANVLFSANASAYLNVKVKPLHNLAKDRCINPFSQDRTVKVDYMQMICAFCRPALSLGQGIVEGHDLSARNAPD